MNVHEAIGLEAHVSSSGRSTMLDVLLTEIGDQFDASVTLMHLPTLISAGTDATAVGEQKMENLVVPVDRATVQYHFASEDPKRFFHLVNENVAAMRRHFDTLERNIRLTPSVRQNPVLRLLRHHWSWRWAELASIVTSVISENIASDRSPFLDYFFPDLFRRVHKPVGGTDYLLVVGPVFNRDHDSAKKIKILNAGLEKFHKSLREAGPQPIYDHGRYFQFAHDRFGVPSGALDRKAEKIAATLATCLRSNINPNAKFHSNDLRHLLHFITTFAQTNCNLSDVFGNGLRYVYNRRSIPSPKSENGEIVLGSVVKGSKIICNGSVASIGELGVFAQLGPENDNTLSQRMIASCGRTNSMRSLRQLEDLAFLRYRLSGSYTRSGDELASIERNYASSAEGDLDRMKTSIVRRILGVSLTSTNASAAVLHRYHHESRSLHPEGFYNRGDRYDSVNYGNNRADVEAWLVAIGADPELRSKSLAYYVVDNDEAVIFDPIMKGVGLHTGTQGIECIQPPSKLTLPQGQCIIAAPVRVHGRLWGVLELASENPQVFSVCDAEFVEKVCHMAGYYYHESLLLETVGSMIGTEDQGVSDYFASLPRKLSRLFLCDAVTVWRQDELDSEKFSCRGAAGREDFAYFSDEALMSEVLTDARRSIAMQTIESGEVWQTGTIGIPPFAGDWLKKDHTRELERSGFKYIALIPIVGASDETNAFISLYSKSAPFGDGWKAWAQFIAAYLSAVLGGIHDKVERESAIRRETFHTIANSIRSAISARDNIKRFIEKLPHSVKENATNLEKWLADLDKHTWDIEQTIDEASFEELATHELGSSDGHSAPAANLWDEFSACFISRRKEMQESKGLTITHGTIDRNIWLKVKADDLRNILANLQANVAKYSSEWTAVQCEFLEKRYSFRLVIKNVGPRSGVSFDARSTIFDRGVRGPYAVAAKISGTGEGLHTVARICNKYGIQYEYRPEPVKSSDSIERHAFSLDFPKRLIKQGTS